MKPPEIKAAGALAALPLAFPTICDLNTCNLGEGEGVSAGLTYFLGLGPNSGELEDCVPGKAGSWSWCCAHPNPLHSSAGRAGGEGAAEIPPGD